MRFPLGLIHIVITHRYTHSSILYRVQYASLATPRLQQSFEQLRQQNKDHQRKLEKQEEATQRVQLGMDTRTANLTQQTVLTVPNTPLELLQKNIHQSSAKIDPYWERSKRGQDDWHQGHTRLELDDGQTDTATLEAPVPATTTTTITNNREQVAGKPSTYAIAATAAITKAMDVWIDGYVQQEEI